MGLSRLREEKEKEEMTEVYPCPKCGHPSIIHKDGYYYCSNRHKSYRGILCEESSKRKPELIVVSKEKASEPDFFEALMDFQYGDQETSDKAFEKMKKKVKK